jgi:hypothetical protein
MGNELVNLTINSVEEFMKQVLGAIATTTIAGLMVAGAARAEDKAPAAKADAKTEMGCQNNSCKGHSACKGFGNDTCKGHNECKGHGSLKAKDEAACKKAGGTWMAKK